MGKFFSALSLFFLTIGCVLLPSCGGSSATRVSAPVGPTGVSITPGGNISLQVGAVLGFSASPGGETFTFQSTNPTVLTISTRGIACAGTWDSLTAPQVCTPGPAGITQVSANALGVSSPPVTVYVHGPITNITISKLPGQQTLRSDCLSKGTPSGPESWKYEAFAFNGTTDITSTVGPFSWQQINPGSANIVALSTPSAGTQGCLVSPQGQCLNEQTVTANTPGLGQIYATASSFNSNPIPIETCPVEKISVVAPNESGNSFLVNSGTSTTLNASVTDLAGQTITGVPLSWSTSNPVSVTASGNNSSTVYGSVGTVGSSAAGAGTVIASCTPPSCNAGIKPTLPIYPQAAMSFTVRSTTTPAVPTVYATTTACSDKIANPTGATCNPTLVPISRTSATSFFIAGTPTALPFSPNSFVYDNNGSNAYLGVDSGNFGQRGLMVFSGSSVSTVTTTPGKVLAISPDRTTTVISDTIDVPNQVFICTNCGSNSSTLTSFLIPNGARGATAAAFSPDNLKAYIVAGSTLYVYSKLDPLQTVGLGSAVNDVAFHPEGGFAYLAGLSSSITAYRTCDNSQVSSTSTSGNPLMIRALPDGTSLLALEPPNIDLLNLTSLTAVACSGTVTETVNPPFNLGQGSFIPTQFFASQDGSTAYILGKLQSVISISAATQSGPNTTYSYTLTSGPALQVGEGIVISGMQNSADNGGFSITSLQSGTFTVSNPFGANSSPASGGATGNVTLHLPFIMVFNIAAQNSSVLSLVNSATPLSIALSPAGDLLFAGADDGTVHVIDTTSGSDTQQVTFPFPTNELCYGPGNPLTQVPLSQVTTSAATQNGSNTAYSYALISGPALKVGQTMVVANMSDGVDNGTFTISSFGVDSAGNPTFIVANSSGANATNQSGTGTVPISCNPDLVAVKP